jgi:hypothetical protein
MRYLLANLAGVGGVCFDFEVIHFIRSFRSRSVAVDTDGNGVMQSGNLIAGRDHMSDPEFVHHHDRDLDGDRYARLVGNALVGSLWPAL